jgi:hypothetical protein
MSRSTPRPRSSGLGGPDLREAAETAARTAHAAWSAARDTWQDAERARARRAEGDPDELEDARELHAYWDDRVRALPVRAIKRRREARDSRALWADRVRQLELERYGSGLSGALAQLITERRLPGDAIRRGRKVTETTGMVVVAVSTLAVVGVLVLVAAVVQAIGSVF